jgi:hypothetical protein
MQPFRLGEELGFAFGAEQPVGLEHRTSSLRGATLRAVAFRATLAAAA